MIIRIPRRFLDDCADCETGTPVIVRTTRQHYYIDPDQSDPADMEDFASRAKYYADPIGFDAYVQPICRSAAATLTALTKAGFEPQRCVSI
jgi:hypothetical protein